MRLQSLASTIIGLSVVFSPFGLMGAGIAEGADVVVNPPPVEIPLVLVLYENEYLGGRSFNLMFDTPTLNGRCDRQNIFGFEVGNCYDGPAFNDVTTSLAVRPGPHYAAYKARYGREPTVTLFQDSQYRGDSVTVQAGEYWDLRPFGWTDRISSVRFGNATATIYPHAPAAPVPRIPVVVVLHGNDEGSDRPRWFFESTSLPDDGVGAGSYSKGVDVIEVAGMRGTVTLRNGPNQVTFGIGHHDGDLWAQSLSIDPVWIRRIDLTIPAQVTANQSSEDP